MAFIIAAIWFVFLSYFLFSFGRLYFGRKNLSPVKAQNRSELPFVSIIIPARNEEHNIKRCVTSLLNQTYPEKKYRVIVVDDNSSDNTASVVRRIGEKHPNLKIISAGPLPEGWAGKNNACRKGAEIADGEWFCFIDADVYAGEELLETAVSFAISGDIGLLSINPFQVLVSISERVFLPGIFLAIAYSMNFTRVNEPSRPEAIANGQFLLFDRRTYESIGGHHAVRNEIMDDLAFARIVKKSDFRLYWIFGENLISARMYRSLLHIWEGFSKNLTEIMRNHGAFGSIYTAMRSFLLAWMPVALPLWTFYNLGCGDNTLISNLAFGLSAIGAGAILLMYLMTAMALTIPFGYGLFIPLGLSLHAILTINSLWNRKRGKRQWKGRTYS